MGERPNNKESQGGGPPPDSSGRRDSTRQYLLGELSEEEHEQIEKRLLSEEDYFEELLIAEEELTDDFVSDRLPGPDRAKFSRRFLPVPELRQDVRFARALRTYAAQNAPSTSSEPRAEHRPSFLASLAAFFRRPAVGLSLAAALLLAVGAATWMAVQNRRLRAEVRQLQTQPTPAPQTPRTGLEEQLASERERAEQLADQLRREQELRAAAERNLEEARRQQQTRPGQGPESGPVVAAVFTLTPGLVRGPGTELQKIPVPRAGGRVLLRLDLAADDYRTYRATLKTVEGKAVLNAAGLRALAGGGGAKAVAVTIPAASLAPGNDYQVLLSGKTPSGEYEDVGSYYFRVVK